MAFELILPHPSYRDSFLAAVEEWDTPELHGFSMHLAKGLDLHQHFERFVNALINEAQVPVPGWATATNRWLVEDGRFLGAGQLRHSLATEYLATRGGHIGYGVRPSARGRGLARVILQGLLHEAKALHMEEVMVTCLRSNPASARTIEACGGVELDPSAQRDMHRYVIPISFKGSCQKP